MHTSEPHRPRRAGFTLLELLVVISIIALLVGILVPSVQKAMALSRRGRCATNLHGCGIAMRMYLNESHDIYPEAAERPSEGLTDLLPIAQVLHPYLDAPEILLCPSDPDEKFYREEGSSYEYNSLLGGTEAVKDSHLQHFIDTYGEENAIVMYDYDNFHHSTGSLGPKNFLYMDGHVSD